MRILIFAHLDDKTGGRCPRHLHQQRTRGAHILVAVVELKPIGRGPVIAGMTAEEGARLKTNNCFAATPVASCVVGVAGRSERIGAVTSDAASTPYTAAVGAGGPCCYTRWIVDRHSHQPAMI